ncbi:MAG TPA: M20 family metallopeptidase [Hyphomicrobiaceae bacterium]|nr:M20 family metallopeptidase [Hyphomicrobiaceae bacterium]
MASGTRSGAIGRSREYVDGGRFEAELGRRVAIRTESQKFPDPRAIAECRRYLDAEMIPAFDAMGFTCKIYDNPIPGQGPILLATRIEEASLPTVLGYGHGDVVVGMDERWTKGKGPWVTARDGDRLYGRGTADNKGQHTLNMAALAAVMAERGGKLGFNAKFMIEMGEEAGSKGLDALAAAEKGAFSADVLVASDGPRVKADRPTITLGCRGAMNFDLIVDLRQGAHHSGNWGGALANPGFILAHALASIVGPKGELLVEELKAPPMSAATKASLVDVELDGGADGPPVDDWYGEPGLKPVERVYAANTFNILAFTCGTPERPVNAIPPKAVANCQLRFIAGTRVADIIPALERHLARGGHTLVKVSPPPATNDGTFGASRIEPDHPWAEFVRGSVQRSSNGKPAVIPSSGGSICNEVFTETLGMPTLWLPHSYASCSQHAPDEHILMGLSRSAVELMAGLYWDIGDGKAPRR